VVCVGYTRYMYALSEDLQTLVAMQLGHVGQPHACARQLLPPGWRCFTRFATTSRQTLWILFIEMNSRYRLEGPCGSGGALCLAERAGRVSAALLCPPKPLTPTPRPPRLPCTCGSPRGRSPPCSPGSAHPRCRAASLAAAACWPWSATMQHTARGQRSQPAGGGGCSALSGIGGLCVHMVGLSEGGGRMCAGAGCWRLTTTLHAARGSAHAACRWGQEGEMGRVDGWAHSKGRLLDAGAAPGRASPAAGGGADAAATAPSLPRLSTPALLAPPGSCLHTALPLLSSCGPQLFRCHLQVALVSLHHSNVANSILTQPSPGSPLAGRWQSA